MYFTSLFYISLPTPPSTAHTQHRSEHLLHAADPPLPWLLSDLLELIPSRLDLLLQLDDELVALLDKAALFDLRVQRADRQDVWLAGCGELEGEGELIGVLGDER